MRDGSNEFLKVKDRKFLKQDLKSFFVSHSGTTAAGILISSDDYKVPFWTIINIESGRMEKGYDQLFTKIVCDKEKLEILCFCNLKD